MAEEILKIVVEGEDVGGDAGGSQTTASDLGAPDLPTELGSSIGEGLQEMVEAIRKRVESANEGLTKTLSRQIQSASAGPMGDKVGATTEQLDAIKKLMAKAKEVTDAADLVTGDKIGATADQVGKIKEMLAFAKGAPQGTVGFTGEKVGASPDQVAMLKDMIEKAKGPTLPDRMGQAIEKLNAFLGSGSGEGKQSRFESAVEKLGNRIESLTPALSRVGTAAAYGGAEGAATAGGMAALGVAAKQLPVVGTVMTAINAAGEMLAAAVNATAQKIRAAGAKAAVEIASNDLWKSDVIELRQKQSEFAATHLNPMFNKQYRQNELYLAQMEGAIAKTEALRGRIDGVARFSGPAASALAQARVTGIQANIQEAGLMGGVYAKYIEAKAEHDRVQQMNVVLNQLQKIPDWMATIQADTKARAEENTKLIKAQEEQIKALAQAAIANETDQKKKDELFKKMLDELQALRRFAQRQGSREFMDDVLKIFEFDRPGPPPGEDPVMGGDAAQGNMAIRAFEVP